MDRPDYIEKVQKRSRSGVQGRLHARTLVSQVAAVALRSKQLRAVRGQDKTVAVEPLNGPQRSRAALSEAHDEREVAHHPRGRREAWRG